MTISLPSMRTMPLRCQSRRPFVDAFARHADDIAELALGEADADAGVRSLPVGHSENG
jgi:hypothetical protein